MHKEHLLEHCVRLYGEAAGPLIHRAMEDIHQKDFCVATGLRLPEISISRGCLTQGSVFQLAGKGYDLITLPTRGVVEISPLTYSDLVKYLPTGRTRSGHQHCFVDNPLTDVIDFSSLV